MLGVVSFVCFVGSKTFRGGARKTSLSRQRAANHTRLLRVARRDGRVELIGRMQRSDEA